MLWAGLSLAGLVLFPACDSGSRSTSGGPVEPPLGIAQLRAPWIQIMPPDDPSLGYLERILQTPDGFVALYRRSLGDGKVVAGWESRLLRSTDGIDWTRQDLLVTEENQSFRDLAYGGGRFITVGHRFQTGAIWSSDDLRTWTEQTVDSEALQAIRHVNGHFFALGTQDSVLSSAKGEDWDKTTTLTLQPRDVASSEDALVLVGTGPFQRSEDGLRWSAHPVDCALPNACVEDPGGGLHQPPSARVLHAAGAFHVDSGWRSTDGLTWDQVQEADVPDGHARGAFFKQEGAQLLAWLEDSPEKVLLDLRAPTGPEDGCLDRACILLGDVILRVPPASE